MKPLPAVAALLLAGLLTGCAAGSATPAPAGRAAPRTGPVETTGHAASCAQGYSDTTLGQRTFAFDGTVTDIGPGRTNRPGTGQLATAAVTFEVHEWFKGGTGTTVTVDLMAPIRRMASYGGPAYERGTRLLVSGEPRWGGPMPTDAMGWSCGFTRYYETAVADAWRQATRPAAS